MELNFKNLFISAVAITAVGGISYALYFDYKRRNDINFRKTLKKKKKEVVEKIKKEKEVKQSAKKESPEDKAARYNELFAQIKAEKLPEDPTQLEEYLFHHLNQGEIKAKKGPEHFEESACHIFRAALVCPNPIEMILLTKNMLPEECYEIVSNLYALEIQNLQVKLNDFYKDNPSTDMNVKFVESTEQASEANYTFKNHEIASTKDFSEGEVIYTETPAISSLAPNYEGVNFCGNCLKEITSDDENIKPDNDYTKSIYCSTKCLGETELEFIDQKKITSPSPIQIIEDSYTSGRVVPAMMARILNRVFKDHSQRLEKGLPKEKYTVMQHVERFTSSELTESEDELNKQVSLLKEYISVETYGIDSVIDLEYYRNIKAKMLTGIFGFSTIKSAEKTIEGSLISENVKLVTSGAVNGFALYLTSAFLKANGSEPNVKATFPGGTSKLTLVATKQIKEGDVLIIQTHGNVTSDEPTVTQETTSLQSEITKVDEGKAELSTSANQGPEANLPSQSENLEEKTLRIFEEELQQKLKENNEEIVLNEAEVSSPVVDLSSSQEFEKIEETNSTPGFDTPPQPDSPQ